MDSKIKEKIEVKKVNIKQCSNTQNFNFNPKNIEKKSHEKEILEEIRLFIINIVKKIIKMTK